MGVLPTPADASGFPSFDAGRERVLLGRVQPGDTPAEAKSSTMGKWLRDDGKLRRDAGTDARAVWLAKESVVDDGMIRVRVDTGRRLQGGVLVRVDADAGLASMSGYELRFDRDTLRFHRYDRGYELPIGPETQVKRLSRRPSLEIVIYLMGPQLLATVYDGESLERLATLAIHDNTHTVGRVGVQAGKDEQESAFGLVSIMEASSGNAKKVKPKYGRLYGPDRDPPSTPFGNTRFVFVPQSAVKELPRDLRRSVRTTIGGKRGEEAVLFVDTVALERLRRTGVEIRAVDSNVPWKTFDLEFRAREGKKPTQTRRGFRIDESYKDAAMIEDLLRGYAHRYPDISRVVELGRTHQGRPILALEISDTPGSMDDEPSVLLSGGHHASELLSVEYPLDIVQQLLEGYGRDPKITGWVRDLELYVVPLANPDGNHLFVHSSRFAGRKNARDSDGDGIADPFEGVDLNRNYLFGWGNAGSSGRATSKYYRGPAPGSEPETRAMVELARKQSFTASISFHTIGTAIFSPYALPGMDNPRPDVPGLVAQQMAAAAPLQLNERSFQVRATGYPVAGSDQDWYYWKHGTLAYVVEGTHHNPPLSVRNRVVPDMRPIWQTLLDRVRDGPRISGHVRDSDGKPLAAEVVIEEIETRMGERWKARPDDGRFDRILATPGRYTVRASLEGYAPQSATVRVGAKPAKVDLVLEPT